MSKTNLMLLLKVEAIYQTFKKSMPYLVVSADVIAINGGILSASEVGRCGLSESPFLSHSACSASLKAKGGR